VFVLHDFILLLLLTSVVLVKRFICSVDVYMHIMHGDVDLLHRVRGIVCDVLFSGMLIMTLHMYAIICYVYLHNLLMFRTPHPTPCCDFVSMVLIVRSRDLSAKKQSGQRNDGRVLMN